MKKLTTLSLLVLFSMLMAMSVTAQIVNIPDANLKAALLANTAINTTDDGEISEAEAASYAGSLNLEELGIANITGLEYFSSLTELILRRNQLTTYDFSSNVALEELNLRQTGISSLDVSPLVNLTYLELEVNNLTALDVSSNLMLTELLLQSNDLTELDVSNNTALRTLRVHHNEMTTLDLSQNGELRTLIVSNTPIASIDLTSNPLLTSFWAQNGQFSSLDLSQNTGLGSLWLENCDNLVTLDLRNNPLTNMLRVDKSDNLEELYLKNGNNENMGSYNSQLTPKLTCISVDDVAYSTENWTFIDEANEFKTYCDPNEPVNIPDANFKGALLANGTLNSDGDANEISYGEAEAYIYAINAIGLGITDLTGLEAFPNITSLSVKDNSLTEVDISNNVELFSVGFENNNLATLDVSNNVKLTQIRLTSNELVSIDISNLPLLEKLWVKDNLLTQLNTSNNPELSDIESGENEITSLDLSNNPKLTTIQTHENNLTSLDVSNNPLLFRITAFYNDISSIDLSNNPMLTSLNFEYNQLSSIDVSMLPILTSFKVRGNGESFVSANLKNGNNVNFTGSVLLDQNPNLTCIQVDDVAYSEANWTSVDDHSAFSTDCNVVVFVDENFESALVADNAINTNMDAFIQVSEAEAYTDDITLLNSGVTDITGIEAFINLDKLDITNSVGVMDRISAVDLSSNTELRILTFLRQNLSELDLSANTKLSYINVGVNSLDELTVNHLPDLVQLFASSNNLSSLDVTANTNLVNLGFQENNLSGINLSNNPSLRILYADGNNLSSLDLSGKTSLNTLRVHNNENLDQLTISSSPDLEEISAHNTGLTDLDVSSNSKISYLTLSGSPILSLDVSNLVDLELLAVSFTSLTSLDLSANTSLESFSAVGSMLTNLNVANGFNSQITTFNIVSSPDLNCIQVDDVAFAEANFTDVDAGVTFVTDECPLEFPDANFKAALLAHDPIIDTNEDGEITPSEAEAFTGTLNVASKEISDLTGIEFFMNLTRLDVNTNNLTSLDISGNIALTKLFAFSNDIEALDVSNNTLLTSLNITGNPLGTLDVTMLPDLSSLQCASCELSVIDVTSNPELTTLSVAGNSFNTVDISQNSLLRNASFNNNDNFTSVNVSNNPALVFLDLGFTSISSVDLSTNSLLETLSIDSNDGLIELDLSVNTSLRSLEVKNNPNLTALNVRNGNNSNFTFFDATNTPNLTCIQVDDPAFSEANWKLGTGSFNVAAETSFSLGCTEYTGTYSVGTGEDFETLDAAMDALINSAGLVGNVTLELADGYAGTGFTMGEIPGADQFDLTIQPAANATNCTIEGSSPISLSTADEPTYKNFTLSGRAGGTGDKVLSIKSTSSSSAAVTARRFFGKMTFDALKIDYLWIAINLDGGVDDVVVKDCEVFSTQELGASGPSIIYGIFLSTTKGEVIFDGNTINISPSGADKTLTAIYLNNGGMSAKLYNNSIHIDAGEAKEVFGVYCRNVPSVIEHNTIDVSGGNEFTEKVAALITGGFQSLSHDGVVIRNNIFVQDGQGSLFDGAVTLNGTGQPIMEGNHFSTSGVAISYFGTEYTTAADFNTAVQALDSQTSGEVTFTDAANGDLSLSATSTGNNDFYSAVPTTLEVDINGDSRLKEYPTKGAYENARSDATDITAFSFTEQSAAASINATNHTISILVTGAAVLTSLSPTITTDGGTISPEGAQDFTSDFTYTVTAENQFHTQDWVVTVSAAPLSVAGFENVSIYPNPTNGSIQISGMEQFTYVVRSVSGKLLLRGSNQTSIDLGQVKAGLYFLDIKQQSGLNQTFRIVKTN